MMKLGGAASWSLARSCCCSCCGGGGCSAWPPPDLRHAFGSDGIAGMHAGEQNVTQHGSIDD